MLPDLRFVFGALMVIAVTGMIGVGLFVSARLFHQAKMGPLESGRNLAFTDSAEWNQFYDPGSVRRYVGLAPQGAPLEMNDIPPAHRLQAPAPAALAVDLAPIDVAAHDDGAEALPQSMRPPVAETAATDVMPPMETTPAIAAPAMPVQTGQAAVAEHPAVLNATTVVDIRPGPAESVVAHSVPVPVRSEPSASEEGPPSGTLIPELTEGTAARAIAVGTENRSDQGPLTTTPVDDDVSDAEAATGKIAAAPVAPESALPRQQNALPSTARPPPATPARAAAPAPVARAPVKRTVQDDEDERPRTISPPRQRALASRPRTAPQAYAPRWNGPQRLDPRPSPGQPVFGPHFPYATPHSRQPVFGPHFPYATPQARRQPAARAPQYRTYSQPSYGPAYGWR